MSSRIIALHGFLGHPSDFRPLKFERIFAPNLFHIPMSDMKSWAERFNRGVDQSTILCGYSMGGRLALHCLIMEPQKYKAAIIIAAHPGMANKKERHDRQIFDLMWAQKFATLPFLDALEQWNSLPVFKNSTPLVRDQYDFKGRILANSLRFFSLGQQAFLPPIINQLDLPILWLFPKEERKKIEALSLKHPHSRMIPIEGGHRFMFLFPEITRALINNFLATI